VLGKSGAVGLGRPPTPTTNQIPTNPTTTTLGSLNW
jgi:hypothetical protein